MNKTSSPIHVIDSLKKLETAEPGSVGYTEMFEHFIQLTYLDKLNYYHAHFNIIPFVFPDFDVEISWYNNVNQLALLTENFSRERPIKVICEKTFLENDRVIKFNVQPSSPIQRILYNKFIITAFLERSHSVGMKFENDLAMSDEPIEFIRSKVNFLISVQQWIRFSLEPLKEKIGLRDQFLQILSNGLNFYFTGKQVTIQKRRKFVELYLFSQGLFFAEQLASMLLLLKEKQKAGLDFSIK